MYGILLIAVLVIMGGVIALIGDRVGSKVGKKKLSLFGLRPRHTSIIVTIVTGICITTLTFIALAVASENVRTALFGMEQMNRTIAETKDRLADTSSRLQSAEAQREKADEALAKSRGEVDKLRDEQKKLEEDTKKLEAGTRALEDEKKALTAKNDELAKESDTLTEQNKTLALQNESLGNENKELEKRNNDLREGLQIMREGEISFKAGEVLSAGIVEGNRPVEDVLNDMGSLIQVANRSAAQRLGVNDERSEVWIYQPEYEKAAETIAETDGDVVVRIVAAGNLVTGEPVRTNLQLFKNSIIYKQNEFIIARPFTMKGNDRDEVESTIMSFLRDVNSAAQAKGILPDPISGSIGVMEGSQFYDVAQAIMPIKGQIILSAYAREDTNALGPLRLILKLESEQE
ncbi:MAG: DUF3084 domain-containing protein [Schwartzia sp.]|nr:DUF3084 domain-containing protein [Schwartzia sp. (in: firmicutes)]